MLLATRPYPMADGTQSNGWLGESGAIRLNWRCLQGIRDDTTRQLGLRRPRHDARRARQPAIAQPYRTIRCGLRAGLRSTGGVVGAGHAPRRPQPAAVLPGRPVAPDVVPGDG